MKTEVIATESNKRQGPKTMKKLYDAVGNRLTKFGAYVSKAGDSLIIRNIRQKYPEQFIAWEDSELLDVYELWLLSDEHQNWIGAWQARTANAG